MLGDERRMLLAIMVLGILLAIIVIGVADIVGG